eukprot:265022-Prorocentrum_minimum.AAC.1
MTEAIELVTQLISKVEPIDMASLDAILKQTDANAEALMGSLAALGDEVNAQVGKPPSFLPRFTPISSENLFTNAAKRLFLTSKHFSGFSSPRTKRFQTLVSLPSPLSSPGSHHLVTIKRESSVYIA